MELHFPKFAKHVVPSKAQAMGESATSASGHTLRNEGRCRAKASIGNDYFLIPFQNMRVDVPILSVRKYVRNGWGFRFTGSGGCMTCRLNGKTVQFIEADGAFWLKMKVKQPRNDVARPSLGFPRPGNP